MLETNKYLHGMDNFSLKSFFTCKTNKNKQTTSGNAVNHEEVCECLPLILKTWNSISPFMKLKIT